ncbi:MAG: CNNM domain-containing protein [Planctomycetota bacterium]
MTAALLILGLAAALVLSGISSGSETGLYCLNRVRLRVAAEQGDSASRRLENLLRRPEDLVILALLGTNIADYLATACVAALLLRAAVSAGMTEFYATAISTPLILVYGGIIPKDWFRRESNRLMARLSGVLWLALRTARATGIVALLRGVTHLVYRGVAPPNAPPVSEFLPRAHTLHLLREGAARGGLTPVQRDLIERVLNLSGVRVADVMIPLSRAATVPHDIPRDDFLRIARMAHFSRLPVYRGQPRRIIGIVNVYDVLTDPEHRPILTHARPPVALTEPAPVPEALLQLQRTRQSMAVVVDRAGLCVGILTLKDLVEEIVGDLEVW